MNLNKELQSLNNRLDKLRRKLAGAQERGDQAIAGQATQEIETITKKINKVKHQTKRQLNKKGSDVKSLPFNRPLTKAEQSDMGKLKKSVKGLVVVHPMTALGREMGITVVTGYAPKEF
ncbi:YibL family ribosome-associated protein [Photobacterium sp. BZF1]|uniref:YibL family ribosome-associated protein n=1 Tax=Photobacterium sp. BZF1 TaxID=1904457 RepID=UPI001653C2EC|nr:YibL family ribosome-associated protein [Photobacterium sp. BZF1]MBC7004498.1 YibL family ribosome-associated protein [Photobacterium sp. BZF1]